VNYDTGNAWYYSKGAIDPVAEIERLASVVAHVHLKSPQIINGLMRWVALGEGGLDLPSICRVLRDRLPGVPVSFELSPRQRSRDFEPRWRTPETPPLLEIQGIISRSLNTLNNALA
jgi:sugar phosphate isomerase/epimerase